MPQAGPTTLTEPRRVSSSPLPDAHVLIEEARRHQRRRHRVLAALILLIIVVSGVVLIASTTASRDTVTKTTDHGVATGTPLVRSRTPLTLDLFWNEAIGWANLSVNLGNGIVHALPEASSVFGLARQGYILGSTNTVTVSMSYDLRHTYHTWTGKYGTYAVPANNPSDIWVTSGTAATEVNEYERPVAPKVALPPGTGVVGQAGPNLVLLGSPPAQLLELWSPAQQRVLATFGAQEYSDADPTANQNSVVWSDRNVVHIDGANGVPGPVVIGPSGEVATSLNVSPDGTRVAIVFQGAPGTTGARTEGVVDMVDVSDGSRRTVPGSAGARGLLAWSPDGSRIFFPKFNRADTSVTMASYRIGSKGVTSFEIPGVHLPTKFNGASGSLAVVGAPARS
jgi:hypothetical protein